MYDQEYVIRAGSNDNPEDHAIRVWCTDRAVKLCSDDNVEDFFLTIRKIGTKNYSKYVWCGTVGARRFV